MRAGISHDKPVLPPPPQSIIYYIERAGWWTLDAIYFRYSLHEDVWFHYARSYDGLMIYWQYYRCAAFRISHRSIFLPDTPVRIILPPPSSLPPPYGQGLQHCWYERRFRNTCHGLLWCLHLSLLLFDDIAAYFKLPHLIYCIIL